MHLIQTQAHQLSLLKQELLIIYPTSQPKPGEAIKFGMFTYIPYAETDDISFDEKHILVVVEPKQDLLASYNQSVSKIIQKTGPQLIT